MSVAAALLSAGLFMTGFALCDERAVFTRIGHRGAPVSAPENTVASVRAAIAAGVDAVEFDVKFTADRQLIVIHDDNLNRTTNGGDLKVAAKTLAELRGLDAGNWGPWKQSKFSGEKLPLPEEMVRAALAGNAVSVVHIAEHALVPDVTRMLAAEKALDRAVVFCFDAHAMERLTTECPEIRKGWLIGKSELERLGLDGVVAKAVAMKCSMLAPEATLVGPELVAKCHKAKLPVWVWTVNEKPAMKRLLDLGVDGVITDTPQSLNVVLKCRNKSR